MLWFNFQFHFMTKLQLVEFWIELERILRLLMRLLFNRWNCGHFVDLGYSDRILWMHFYLRRRGSSLKYFVDLEINLSNYYNEIVERIPILSFCITSILLAILENSKNFCFHNSTIKKNWVSFKINYLFSFWRIHQWRNNYQSIWSQRKWIEIFVT